MVLHTVEYGRQQQQQYMHVLPASACFALLACFGYMAWAMGKNCVCSNKRMRLRLFWMCDALCVLAGLIRSVLGCTAAFTLLAILAYATDNALALWVCMPHERCARRIYTQNREAMGNGKRHKHTQYKILCVRAERWGWEIYTRCMAMGIFNGSVYIPFGSGLYARVFTFSRSSYNVGRLRSVLCAEHTAHKMYSCFEHTAFRCRDVV